MRAERHTKIDTGHGGQAANALAVAAVLIQNRTDESAGYTRASGRVFEYPADLTPVPNIAWVRRYEVR